MRVLVVVLGVLALLVPAPAWAHATLVDSSPQQGEQLAQLPTHVRFEFNQDMSSPAYVIVTAPDGTSMTTGEPQVDGAVITQDITEGPDGAYTMAYRAVSEDGHPVTGEITFSVGTAGAAASSPGASHSDAGKTHASTDTSPAQASDDDSFLSRHQLALIVGVGLFLLAALMLLLARRTSP